MMQVNLVSITGYTGTASIRTAEDLIIYTARVSSPSTQEDVETAPRLLKYLVEHCHWSPFEMVDMTVEIETSRAIAAQILRHRSFFFQEFSQRYSPASLGFETVSARRQASKNRQGSIDDMEPETKLWFQHAQRQNEEQSQTLYETALHFGVALEQARFLLPLSTRTRLYMKGSVRSWIHYLQVRLAPEAQAEHREVAKEIAEIFKAQFPHTYAAAFKEE
jgi:thymidylate synthase (FAD)